MCFLFLELAVVSTVLDVVIQAMEVAALKKLDIAHLNDNTYGKMMASLDQVIYMVCARFFR